MKLRRLTVRNFMPYRGEQTVEFPVGSQNVLVIYGDNMRGKTSFLNALRFAFFGKATVRQLRDIEFINLINRGAREAGDWTLSVTVEFEAGGSLYEARRELTRAPHVARPQTNDDFRLRFWLRKDGHPLSDADVPSEMNQVMPEGISRFFLFDGELLQEYEILVRDADAAAKIKLAIEHVLGVPALTKGRAEIRALLQQAQKRQAEDLQHLASLRSQAEQQRTQQQKLSEARTAYGTLVNQKEKADDAAAELQERIESRTEAIDLTKQLSDTETAAAANRVTIANLRRRRADLLQDAWKDLLEPRLQIVRRGLEEDRERHLEAVRASAVLLSKIADLRGTLADDSCSLCGQSLDQASRGHVVECLEAGERQIAATQTGLEEMSALSNRIEQLARLHGSRVAQRILAVERELRDGLRTATQLADEAKRLRETLRDFDPAEVERLRDEREQLVALSASYKREMDQKALEIATINRKLDQISRMLARNPEARGQLSSRLVAAYGALDRIFSGGVDKLRDQQRRRVERFASAAFSLLTSEKSFSRLSINENYGLTILDEHGETVPERSAGAEQIVALSLIDGLNRAGRGSGPIVMDTPFGRLDWKHRENVLNYLPQMAEQVVLLVHEGEMDRQRDLAILGDRVAAIYRIERVTAQESRLVLEGESEAV